MMDGHSHCIFLLFRFYFSPVCTLFYFCWIRLFPSRKVKRVEVFHHNLFRPKERRLASTLFLLLYSECIQYFKSASVSTSKVRFFDEIVLQSNGGQYYRSTIVSSPTLEGSKQKTLSCNFFVCLTTVLHAVLSIYLPLQIFILQKSQIFLEVG